MNKIALITPDVRAAVEAATVHGNRVTLAGQLDRKIYVAVNELLSRLGGKWNSKAGAHIFDRDPRPLLQEALSVGALPPKNPFSFYETPAPLMEMILSRIEDFDYRPPAGPIICLEPSAGQGAIAGPLFSYFANKTNRDFFIDMVEIDEGRCQILRQKGFSPRHADFMTLDLGEHDLIVMNPPFTTPDRPFAALDHTLHAYNMLAAMGLLVAILPSGWCFRTDARHTAFRSLVEGFGSSVDNPAGSFSQEGTEVNTTTVFLTKGGQR